MAQPEIRQFKLQFTFASRNEDILRFDVLVPTETFSIRSDVHPQRQNIPVIDTTIDGLTMNSRKRFAQHQKSPPIAVYCFGRGRWRLPLEVVLQGTFVSVFQDYVVFVSLFEATVETYDRVLSVSCCSGTYSIVNVGQTLESTVFFLALSLSIPSIVLLYHIGVTVRVVIFLLLC